MGAVRFELTPLARLRPERSALTNSAKLPNISYCWESRTTPYDRCGQVT